MSTDTIFALATPPGKSGVAVLRLSGPQALAALYTITAIANPTPRKIYYALFQNGNGETIDKGLAIYFKAPHSFTGEDIVELQAHGSIAVIRQLLDALSKLSGLRPAEPGEFTKRAFINGKMDLLEAEGLADLIDAETEIQKTQAMRQMHGQLSSFYNELRTGITHALAMIEAYIDFPEEEIPQSVVTQLAADINALQAQIKRALGDRMRGERLREGITVVLLGAPNAGKSSLLNAIAKRDAAIVSARAGTTRDVIEVHLDIAGFPVVLMDTAGIRDASDEIEEEGVKRALSKAAQADITLVLFDGANPSIDKLSMDLLDERSIPIVNKSDILIVDSKQLPAHPFMISAKTGKGMDVLLAELERRVTDFFSSGEAPFITRQRHRSLLEEAYSRLEKSLADRPLELRCEELRLAAQAVGKITGKIAVDDVLDVIFKSFCIGK